MLLFLLLLAVVVVLVIMAVVSKSQEATTMQSANVSQKPTVINMSEVSNNFASSMITFFNSYLCLCKVHSVGAVCGFHSLGKDDMGIRVKAECIIVAIDGEHGNEAFRGLEDRWMIAKQREKAITGDPLAGIHAGDNYVRDYFGCKNLHSVFLEVDEYQFEGIQAMMAFETVFFTTFGAKWDITLRYIQQELKKKWPNAVVSIGAQGMSVSPE